MSWEFNLLSWIAEEEIVGKEKLQLKVNFLIGWSHGQSSP